MGLRPRVPLVLEGERGEPLVHHVPPEVNREIPVGCRAILSIVDVPPLDGCAPFVAPGVPPVDPGVLPVGGRDLVLRGCAPD